MCCMCGCVDDLYVVSLGVFCDVVWIWLVCWFWFVC